MNIKQIAEALDFKQIKGVYCKDLENFHLTLLLTQPHMAVVATCAYVLNKPVGEEDFEEFVVEFGKKVIRRQNNLLFVDLPKLTNGFKKKEEDIAEALELIEKVSEKLTILGYTNYAKCAFCSGEDNLEYDVVNDLYLPIHPECLQEAINDVAKEIEQENSKLGRLPLSIMLTVAGAVVGLIPTIVMIYLTETIYALLFTLIPICGMVGYKLGGGPRNKIMTVTTIISSVAVVFGFSVVIYILAFLASNAQFGDFLSANIGAILGDLARNLLFIAIGIWISWKLISNTKENQYKNLKK